MSTKPKIPSPVTPATRPERTTDVEPEDVQLGDANANQDSSTPVGKRSLVRPTGATSGIVV